MPPRRANSRAAEAGLESPLQFDQGEFHIEIQSLPLIAPPWAPAGIAGVDDAITIRRHWLLPVHSDRP
jgi:hypothetical protein